MISLRAIDHRWRVICKELNGMLAHSTDMTTAYGVGIPIAKGRYEVVV